MQDRTDEAFDSAHQQAEGGHSWKQAAQIELFYGWQRWVSFTCIWVWSCITSRIAFDNHALQQLPGILSAPNETTLIASAVVLLIILALSKKLSSIIDSKPSIILAGVLLTTGSFSYLLGIVTLESLFFTAGMIGGGATIALLKIAWGEMYSRMGLRHGLISMGYALVASTIIVLLARDMPQIAQAALLVFVSIPCAPLAYFGTRRLEAGFKDPMLSSKPVTYSVSLLLLPAMVAFSYGIVKGMMPWLEGAETAFVDSAFRYAELLVGVSLIVFSYMLGKRFGAAQIYSIALIFVVASLMLLSAQGVPRWISFFIHDIGFSLFYFFMVVYWGDLSRRTGKPIVLIYTIVYGTFQMVQIIGSLVGFYVVEDTAQNFTLLILLSVVLAFFVVALLLLSNNRSPLRQWLIADETAVSEQGDEIPPACTALASTYGLSPREHEVLGLLARGRNASYVARTLYISHDTAKTHIKNIYRKLDVHTQQELIDKIDTAIEE